MAKRSILDITQQALLNIGSDSVNSISDTDEARDVSFIIRDAYFDFIASQNWPHLREVINLSSVSDTSNPAQLILSDDIQKIDNDTLYYDTRQTSGGDPEMTRMTYCDPEVFLNDNLSLSSRKSDTNITEMTSPAKLYIFNDRAPTRFTSFDDELIIFDAYDSDVDTTLQGSKSTVLGYKETTFSLVDTFEVDLPSKAFPQFMADVKERVSLAIAQERDVKQEALTKSFKARSEGEKWRTRDGIRKADFGRRRSSRTTTWRKRS